MAQSRDNGRLSNAGSGKRKQNLDDMMEYGDRNRRVNGLVLL